MVGLHAIKSTFDDNGIKDGFVEGNLSVEELMTIITAVFENQSGVRGTNRIDVSLASELVLNWILNVYDPWVHSYPPPPLFYAWVKARVSNEKQLYLQANKLKNTITNIVSIFALQTNFLTSFLLLFYPSLFSC